MRQRWGDPDIVVDEGILDTRHFDYFEDKKGQKTRYDYIVGSYSSTLGLFYFLAKNTAVEWSFVSALNKDGVPFAFLSTSHSPENEGGGTDFILNYGAQDIFNYKHSHSFIGIKGPSGATHDMSALNGDGDMDVLRQIAIERSQYTHIIYQIYDVPRSHEYTYDSTGNITNDLFIFP